MSSGFKSDCIKYYRKYVMNYMLENFNGTGPNELKKLISSLNLNLEKLEIDLIFIHAYKKVTNDFTVDLIFPEYFKK